MIKKDKTCPQCKEALPVDAPEGICPKCLLQAGLAAHSANDSAQGNSDFDLRSTSATSGGFVPPEPSQLAEQFPQLEVIRLIGRGGMGAVYEARQSGLDRKVALKILPPEFGSDPAFAQRFTREARALAKLSHQNIVSVFDIGQAEGQYYFIMEFVDGANLRHLMESGNVSPAEALKIVSQICGALQFAHQQGVVHRDIKPENILVDKQGQVKIADFGLAKLVGGDSADVSLTATEQIMGTFRYMAPEQMQGTKSVDHRADIFSLGVIFYELLTGEIPMGKFDPPSKVKQTDERLDEVVLRALEKEPTRRYQQASEVSTDIESISRQKTSDTPTEKPNKEPSKMSLKQSNDAKANHADPYGGSKSNDMPNYGLLILGGLMIALGVPMLATALLTPTNQVFVWIGLGLSLGGGGLCTVAFVEGSGFPAGTRTHIAPLFGGLFMTALGGGLLLLRFISSGDSVFFDSNDVFVWIGIGLWVGGGGVCCAAWIDETKSQK